MSERQDREVIKAWITKWALTKGIILTGRAEVCADINPGMLDAGALGYHHGHDWHRTEAAAVKRAEEMRIAKVASLKKQIAKLKAKRFT